MPVILATQEAVSRRIVVQSQPSPRKIVHEALSRKHPLQKKGWPNSKYEAQSSIPCTLRKMK
jgi:hypothetical protein